MTFSDSIRYDFSVTSIRRKPAFVSMAILCGLGALGAVVARQGPTDRNFVHPKPETFPALEMESDQASPQTEQVISSTKNP